MPSVSCFIYHSLGDNNHDISYLANIGYYFSTNVGVISVVGGISVVRGHLLLAGYSFF